FKLSFLLSVPAVMLANIFLKANGFTILPEYVVGGLVAFIVGLVSIDFVLKTIKKIEFWKICVIIALLNILFVFV
ncbi:MAG: undecaprenyl-diphosphate phosphatase, partial [Nanoarchaeota archaeon]|nr:undecaprenyl-diphosphate phosphatase [Nanoarchaeota archaeon]